jgi:hypothetical protein
MDARKLILDYIHRNGISQGELGRRVGLHRVTMTRYLNYTIDLAGDRLVALMDEAGYEWCPKPNRDRGNRKKGRRKMDSTTKVAPYALVREMIEAHGGTMTFHAGGGPGGLWRIELQGRTLTVDVRDRRVNDLDRLYVAKLENPQTWDDYEPNCPLKPGAFWQLVKLIDLRGA